MGSVEVRGVTQEQTGGQTGGQGAGLASGRCRGSLRWAFGFLGKRWNGILLSTLMAGPLGFADLRRTIGGISDSMLSERLSELTRVGLVARRVRDTVPPTVEYQLTPTGQNLLPVLEELATWASGAMQTCPNSAEADTTD